MSGTTNGPESPSPEIRATCTEVAAETAAVIHAGHDSEGWEFEVFLSFRGADTRTNFTDFLYEDLVRAGIRAFRDDDELQVGEEIGPELYKALKQSKIYIPIFSQNYANSKWCLRELVTTVKYHKEKGRAIMPIFYDVEPADVKHQTGSYTNAFYELETNQRVPKSTLRQWKDALRFVAELKGWEVKKNFDGHQGRLVKKLVSEVSERLNVAYLDITENLVGFDDQVDEVMRLLDTDSSDVRIVGIYGMAGIGKTTLAKFIYNNLANKFQHSSFLPDVKDRSDSKGIEKLQKQFISDILGVKVSSCDQAVKVISERFRTKKALILIDDVDHSKQLEMLARRPEWFGPGSRIIITTRNKQVFDEFDIDMSYEVKPLNTENSLKLLWKHAFRKDTPLPDFVNLSKSIVATTGGLPLSIRVIGALLHNKEQKLWKDILKKLKGLPDKEVLTTLRLSYDVLEDWQKQMFLDIACLFIGFDRATVSYMWESCDFFPEYGVAILINMSLIKVDEENKLRMHDHLKDLGREIAREKHETLGKPTRLWCYEEAISALKGKNMGVDFVTALCLGVENSQYTTGKLRLTANELKGLYNLVYFQVGSADIYGDFKGLLPELRWLQWSVLVQYPFMNILSNFRPEKLVILDLSNSIISEKWRGWRLIKDAKNLKVLDVSNCLKLRSTPKFPLDSVLERLILTGCKNLIKIHPSVGKLNCLVVLDLKGCESLDKLPLGIPDEACETAQNPFWTLNLSSLTCTKASTLSIRDPQGTSEKVEEPPRELQVLNLSNCHCIHSLPEDIGIYEQLTELYLGHTNVSRLPESVGDLAYLRVLILSETPIEEFPSSIWCLQNLEVMDAFKCRGLGGEISYDIGNLSFLRILRIGFTKISFLPRTISGLTRLEELDLSDLSLELLPELPASLKRLSACCSSQSKTTHLAKLINLEELELDQGLFPIADIGTLYKLKKLTFKSYHTTLPTGLAALQRLVTLKIESSSIIALPLEIKSLGQLRELSIYDCNELGTLPGLPSTLSKLHLSVCCSLEDLGDMSNLKCLSSLTIDRCAVIKIKGLHALESLTELCLCYCHNLHALDGLEQLACLSKLYIYCCVLKERLPDLSNLKNLIEVYNHGCSEDLVLRVNKFKVDIISDPIEEFEF